MEHHIKCYLNNSITSCVDMCIVSVLLLFYFFLIFPTVVLLFLYIFIPTFLFPTFVLLFSYMSYFFYIFCPTFILLFHKGLLDSLSSCEIMGYVV